MKDRTGSTTVFRDSGEVLSGGRGARVASTVRIKRTEVLLSLPLKNTYKVLHVLFCPFALSSHLYLFKPVMKIGSLYLSCL